MKVNRRDAEESPNTPILIKTYGEYWSPEVVDWGRSWRLMGKRHSNPNGPSINVYEERGIYVLYKDYEPVYVGKADRQSLGYRLQLHRESLRKGPRWDRFSWFGVIGLTDQGKLRSPKLLAKSRTAELIATLEALLIMAISPVLNARREKFKNAVLLDQSEEDRLPDSEDRLQKIEEMLASLTARKG